MTTDEERRSIAQGLRIHGADWCGMEWRYRLPFLDGGVYMCCDGSNDELKDAALQLADLIEPSCDRDALLVLADEMDRDGCTQRERQKAGERWFIDGLDVREYARRIREACGETS